MSEHVDKQPAQIKDSVVQSEDSSTDMNQKEQSDSKPESKKKRGFLVIDLFGIIVVFIVAILYFMPDDEQDSVLVTDPTTVTTQADVPVRPTTIETEAVVEEQQSPEAGETAVAATEAVLEEQQDPETGDTAITTTEAVLEEQQDPETGDTVITTTEPVAEVQQSTKTEDNTTTVATAPAVAMKPLSDNLESKPVQAMPAASPAGSTLNNAPAATQTTASKTGKTVRLWSLNLLSTPLQSTAKRINQQLQADGVQSQIISIKVGERTYYRIRVLNYASKQLAAQAQQSFRSRPDYKHAWISSYSKQVTYD